MEKLIDEAPTKIRKKTNKPVSFDTIKTYKSTLTKLLQFEEYMSKKIKYKIYIIDIILNNNKLKGF